MIEPVNADFKKSKVLYNFFFSSLSTFLNMVVPLLTYPYIARILGPANMGKLGVAASLTNYFIVAASLGLPVYGMREIARTRSDRKTMGNTASELFIISLFSSAISTIVYTIIIYVVPQYRNDFGLFIIFGATIITSTLFIEWFFQGIEQFRYIGLRNVFIKAAFVICLFLMVKKENDYKIYALLFIGSSFIAMVVNVLSATRYVRFSFKRLNLFRHVEPMIVFAILSFLITAYTNLDFLFLGLFSDNVQAGFYNISIRLARMIITFIATLSTVLMPKLAASADTRPEEFRSILRWSADLIVLFALPAGAGLFAVSGDLAVVFAGKAFAASASSLRITAFLVPVVALSNFLQMQILIPQKKEKKMLISFFTGLFVTGAAMALLVPRTGQIGAAWGMLAGELSVLIVHTLLCNRSDARTIFDRKTFLQYFAGAILCAAFAYGPVFFMNGGAVRLLVSIVAGSSAYFVYLVMLKNEQLLSLLRYIRKK